MQYLVDTNIWLEVLLDQEHAAAARDFLEQVDANELAITDFALYSLAIILTTRFKKDDLLQTFIQDTLQDSGVTCIHLDTPQLVQVLNYRRLYSFDFDDAYQYTAAEQNQLILVSLDPVFDKTPRGRKTPDQILTALGHS